MVAGLPQTYTIWALLVSYDMVASVLVVLVESTKAMITVRATLVRRIDLN